MRNGCGPPRNDLCLGPGPSSAVITSGIADRRTELGVVNADINKRRKNGADHLADACGAMTQILRLACAGRQSEDGTREGSDGSVQ